MRTCSSVQLPLPISRKHSSPSVPPTPCPNEKPMHIVHIASRSSSHVGSRTTSHELLPSVSMPSSVSSSSSVLEAETIATPAATARPLMPIAASMSAHTAALMSVAFSTTLSRSMAFEPSSVPDVLVFWLGSSCVASEKDRKGLENLVVGRVSVWSDSWISERGCRLSRRSGRRMYDSESARDFVPGPAVRRNCDQCMVQEFLWLIRCVPDRPRDGRMLISSVALSTISSRNRTSIGPETDASTDTGPRMIRIEYEMSVICLPQTFDTPPEYENGMRTGREFRRAVCPAQYRG